MPAKSQAQRAMLNAKFGHKWVKRHHFDNKGKLPAHVSKQEALTARQMFARDHLHEGRDDAPKLGLGKTGLKFARMGSREAFKSSGSGGAGTDSGGDAKWNTSVKLRTELAGEKLGGKMKSADKVGKVKFGGKGLGEAVTPEQVVTALLEQAQL